MGDVTAYTITKVQLPEREKGSVTITSDPADYGMKKPRHGTATAPAVCANCQSSASTSPCPALAAR